MAENQLHFNNDEKVLLLKIAKGDEESFTAVFNTYYPLLSTHIFKITRSFPLTQEIVQDVFLKIWMSRETLVSINDFKGYLWVAAKNHALNALARIARERINHQKYREQPTAVSTLPEEENTYLSIIDAAIALLPPRQQEVYLLSRRERMRHAEIAKKMGITVSTVKKYIQLATESITEYIKARLPLILLMATCSHNYF